jgi:RNA polymerase sigma factor (sigma-70 family)
VPWSAAGSGINSDTALAADRHDLILSAQRGDARSIDRLLAECRGDVRRYALRHCATSEIDDAVQEALLIVARHVRSLKTAASFAGWLFTIVRRECQRLSRKIFSHEDLADEKIETKLAERSNDELRLELAFALESLPAHYLEILLLRDFEELTISEICQRLNVTSATAKSRLRRGRLLVREYLLGGDVAQSDHDHSGSD